MFICLRVVLEILSNLPCLWNKSSRTVSTQSTGLHQIQWPVSTPAYDPWLLSPPQNHPGFGDNMQTVMPVKQSHTLTYRKLIKHVISSIVS